MNNSQLITADLNSKSDSINEPNQNNKCDTVPVSSNNSNPLDTATTVADVSKTPEDKVSLETFQKPDDNLILGKFKSQDDLAQAYQEIQKLQGNQSQEIGELRKKARLIDEIQKHSELYQERRTNAKQFLDDAFKKYDHDNYFKNNSFNSLFSEAFKSLGPSLNMDVFIPLLENYVNSRISMYNKVKSAQSETESATDNMGFNVNNNVNSINAPLNSLSGTDLEKALDRLI